MKLLSKTSPILICFLILVNSCNDQKPVLIDWLSKIDGLDIEKIEPDSVFAEAYRIFIPQYLDHDNPGAVQVCSCNR